METNNINAAMAAVMIDIEAISKARRNEQQGFKFRGIDDAYNELHPLLAKHGIVTLPKVLKLTQQERTTAKGNPMMHATARVRFRFQAKDGSYVDAITVGEAMDTGDKSAGKAQSYAHKVALLQTFTVPTEDTEDPDKQSHELGRPQKQQEATTPPEEDPPHIAALLADPDIVRRYDALGTSPEKRRKGVRTVRQEHLAEDKAKLIALLDKALAERALAQSSQQTTLPQQPAQPSAPAPSQPAPPAPPSNPSRPAAAMAPVPF